MKTIVRASSITSATSRFAASASTEPRAPRRLVDQRRVPHRDRALRARRAVARDHRARRRTPSAARPARPGWRPSRDASRKRGAVPCSSQIAPQPPQHVGHVRAEDAAVDVRLVDHHDREVAEEVAPRPDGWGGSRRAACPGWSARRWPAGAGRRAARAACRRRRSPPASRGSPNACSDARLVLRQRLGRIEEQRARARVAREQSSVGSWKHSDLPDAVPVVMIVVRSQADSSASA